jgi:hypothetical protein
MPMTRIEELEHQIQRDGRNMLFTGILFVAVILLIALAWSQP